MKRLGQNFLINLHIQQYLASLVKGKILEIGAGTGNITRWLKGEVYAVEIDKDLCEQLNQLNVNLICKDFLELEPFEVDYIVGNVPYYISSPILFRISKWTFKRAYLILQYEFAHKMLAKPGDQDYGRLSVNAQLYFNIKKIKKISRYSFKPIPNVDSMLIELTKKDYNGELDEIVRILFSQRNKKVSSILRKIGIEFDLNDLKDKRPRHLSIEEIYRIHAGVAKSGQRRRA